MWGVATLLFIALVGCSIGDGETLPTTPLTEASSEGSSQAKTSLEVTIAAQAAPAETTATPQKLMSAALSQVPLGETAALREMGNSRDPSYIPVLVEFLQLEPRIDPTVGRAARNALKQLLETYLGRQPAEGREWSWVVEWLGQHPEITAPGGYAGFKGRLYTRFFNNEVGSFFYDGVKTRIRLEEVVWGGVAEAGIPALTNPPVVSADEATYLAPWDRVFGISINGQHRAYPHRVMNLHEMANDVVGGVPIALAY